MRLREIDQRGDKDGNLNKLQISNFCLSLELVQEDADVICDLAQLGPKKSKINLVEFQHLCEDQRDIEELFMLQIFKRLIAETKRRGLTYDQLFDRINFDRDGRIKASEVDLAFKSIEISLDSRDMPRVWKFMDKNNDGSIN